MSASALLRGASAIGRYLGIRASEVSHLERQRLLPSFRMPGDSAPFATPGALEEWSVAVGRRQATPLAERVPDLESILADLASLWVQRWLAYGGWLSVPSGADKVSIGMRMDWRRKDEQARSGRPPMRLWHDGWVTGRWRELGELAERVPGLTDAIVHHVASVGSLDPTGARVMMAQA